MIYTVTLNPAIDRELQVSEIIFDTILRAIASQVDLGGKGFNVSRLLASFDTSSIALGFVGGESGKFLEKGLQKLGIQTDFIYIKGETRTNFSIFNKKSLKYIKVNEPGPYISDQEVILLIDKINSLASSDDWWVLSGSLPPGCPNSIYNQIINIVQEKGGRAILDTSGEPLRSGCIAKPYLCKPNLSEAKSLAGTFSSSTQELAERIMHFGPSNVVISLGSNGVVYHGEMGSFLVEAPTIEEKNPIGAGDSFVGGMLWALHQGLNFHQAVQWGVACGAGAAALQGTSVVTKKEAEILFQ